MEDSGATSRRPAVRETSEMTPGSGSAPERRCAKVARRKDHEPDHPSTSLLSKLVKSGTECQSVLEWHTCSELDA